MISRARSRYYNEWHCVYSHEPHYWVYKLCQTLCNPMRCSTPGFPILHCLLDCSDLFPLCWWCYLPTSFQKLLVHTNKTHQTIMYSFSVRIVIIKVSGWGLSWWSCGLRPWASAGGGGDSIPGQGSKIPHPEWWGKKRKKVKKPLKRERERWMFALTCLALEKAPLCPLLGAGLAQRWTVSCLKVFWAIRRGSI